MRSLQIRCISFLLVLMLVFSTIPLAYAAETDGDISTAQTETITSNLIPEEVEVNYEEGNDFGIMPMSGEQSSGVKLLNLATPYNYTISLTSQVYVKYHPNGSDAAKTAGLKNLGWHYFSYDGIADANNTVYCIEPYKDYNAGSPGCYVDKGVDVGGSNTTNSIGSNAWYNMPQSYRRAVSLILLFSEARWDYSVSVTEVSKNNNPNFGLRTATQILIFEIVTGLRDPNTFNRNDSNGYANGRTLYDAFKDQAPNFRDYYNGIVSDVQSMGIIPSFTASDSSTTPIINLQDSITTINDSNGVVRNFTFIGDNTVRFQVSGDDLTIERLEAISPNAVFSCQKEIPSPNASRFNLFYSYSTSYQTCVNLLSPEMEYAYGYFRLYDPPRTGNLDVCKITEDSQNLKGWPFSVYMDLGCTNLAAGPYYTDTYGITTIPNLPAGTYYVKEMSHGTDFINSRYYCSSANPQQVVINAGNTSSVSFHNKLNFGNVMLVKETNTGENLSGWSIGLYTDSSCTSPVDGSPFITGSDGTITVSGLKPDTYYAKELSEGDGYWICDTSVKTITVNANQTSSVIFTNTQCGKLKISKTMKPSGSTEGWQFRVTDADGKEVDGSPFTMNASGEIDTGKLLPGIYTVEELTPEGSLYYCESENPQTVTIAPSQTAEVSFVNCLKSGSISIHKVNSHNEPLAGAIFLLEWSEDKTNWEAVHYVKDGPEKGGSTTAALKDGYLTSGTDGNLLWDGLYPGLYYRITEIAAPEGYELLKDYAFEGQIPDEDMTLELKVVNGLGFVLPETGSNAAQLLHYAQLLTMSACAVLLLLSHRKKEW